MNYFDKNPKLRRLAALALLIISASFSVYGILRGEPAIVLKKAIRICMECIGLG